ncbi:MAG: hypothetical protein ACFWTU_07535 [Leuconostoc mesenteroides]|jgi:hypothetical protein
MTQLVRKTMLVIFLFLWAVCAIYGYGRLQELTEHCKLLKNLSW